MVSGGLLTNIPIFGVGRAALPIETYLYSNEIPTSQGYRRYLSSDGKELYAEEGSFYR